MAKVEADPHSNCWLWNGKLDNHGYGRFTAVGWSGTLAHRWSFEHFVGAIPAGLTTIDHLCHNDDRDCAGGNTCLHRACVNPEHLEAVTLKTNVLRGKSFSAKNAQISVCVRGHTLTGANVRRDDQGRNCRECERIRASEYDRLPATKKKRAAARMRNRGKIRARNLAYYEQHKATISEQRRANEDLRRKDRERARAYRLQKRLEREREREAA